ncbi:aromatic-ring-hydroxylating dioxygenase subunit beta [Nocardia sp. X0981]
MTERTHRRASLGHGTAIHDEISDWTTREVHLLDDGLLEEWYATLHPDITYSMPLRLSLMPKDGPGFRDDMDYFMDDHASIRMRINRLKTEMAWAEQPGSRTRHLVTNLSVELTGVQTYDVRSQFFVTRARADQSPDLFSGVREDVLVRDESGALLLKKRRVLLDQSVLKSFNLSFFF